MTGFSKTLQLLIHAVSGYIQASSACAGLRAWQLSVWVAQEATWVRHGQNSSRGCLKDLPIPPASLVVADPRPVAA